MNKHTQKIHKQPHDRHGGFIRLGAIWLIAWCSIGMALLWSARHSKYSLPSSFNQGVFVNVAGSGSPRPGHMKNIEDVKAGDHVWAFDPNTDQWAAKEVLKPLVHDYSGDLVTIFISDRTIQATGNHPFWVKQG